MVMATIEGCSRPAALPGLASALWRNHQPNASVAPQMFWLMKLLSTTQRHDVADFTFRRAPQPWTNASGHFPALAHPLDACEQWFMCCRHPQAPRQIRRFTPLSRPRPQQAASSADALHMPQDGVNVPGPAEQSQSPPGPAGSVDENAQAERAQPPGEDARSPLLAGAGADAAAQLGIAAAGGIAAPSGAPADVPGRASDLAGAAQASAAQGAGASIGFKSSDEALKQSTGHSQVSHDDVQQTKAAVCCG